MAVSRVPQGSRMIITIENGVTVGGLPKYIQRTYKGVKADAIDADVYAVAQGMADLQKFPSTGISRFDEGNLVNV